MKNPQKKSVVFALLVVTVIVLTSFLFREPPLGDSPLPTETPTETDRPTSEPTPPRNLYPVFSESTAYGSLSRVGSQGRDSAEKSYLLGEFLYLFFSSDSAGYDSPASDSLSLAKLDKNGVLLSVLGINSEVNEPALRYRSSKPVQNGIVLSAGNDRSHFLIYISLDLAVIKSVRTDYSPTASAMYFFNDKLYVFYAGGSSLSCVEFDGELNSIDTKSMLLKAPFDILNIYPEDAEDLLVAVNFSEGFSLLRLRLHVGFSDALSGEKRLADIVPSKDGYAFLFENGGLSICDRALKNFTEKHFDGTLGELVKTTFGYVLSVKKTDTTEFFFLCPHFDTLLKKTVNGIAVLKNLNGTPYAVVTEQAYVHFFKLTDFDILPVLTTTAVNATFIDSHAGQDSRIFLLSASAVTGRNGYGGTDIFVLIF
ncbi:MAG: hypothetical protein LBT20_05890 [Clostridiales bacterium]|jgi:hypothetical protein|nr:hypothetical protein [Clostridiales bacterium]